MFAGVPEDQADPFQRITNFGDSGGPGNTGQYAPSMEFQHAVSI